MAKWRGTATVVFYFDAPDKRQAERLFELSLIDVEVLSGYRDPELEEIDDKEFEREENK